MNRDNLITAIGDIRDEFLLEAMPVEQAPIPFYVRYRKQLSLAASFILVIGLAGLAMSRLGGQAKGAAKDTAFSGAAPTMAYFDEEAAPTEEECMDLEALMMAAGDNAETDALDGAASIEEGSDFELNDAEYPLATAAAAENSGDSTESPELNMAAETEALLWRGTGFRFAEWMEEIPEGFYYEGETGTAEDSLVQTTNPLLNGYPVFLSATDITSIYVAYPDGYAHYTAAEK